MCAWDVAVVVEMATRGMKTSVQSAREVAEQAGSTMPAILGHPAKNLCLV